jgi:hypothetical protein
LGGYHHGALLVNFLNLFLHQLPPDSAIPEPLAGSYGAQGLQAMGVHTPEFGFEHTRHNVADAVGEFGIRYTVGQDNAFQTWRAWGNEAWPEPCGFGGRRSPGRWRESLGIRGDPNRASERMSAAGKEG